MSFLFQRSRFSLPRNRVRACLRSIRAAERSFATLPDNEFVKVVAGLKHRQLSRRSRLTATNKFIGLIAESIFRDFGFRLHDVQLHAIQSGRCGAILEMQTGEGKTLVTGAIAALLAQADRHVHVYTTNLYLAERDYLELKPTFDRLGLSSGLLTDQPSERRAAYRQQIVYGPGYQFSFDYLSDQMFLREARLTQPGQTTVNRIAGHDPAVQLMQSSRFDVALIDEADSVMIDEATTSLIISLPNAEKPDPHPYQVAHQTVATFREGEDFDISRGRIVIRQKALQQAHDAVRADRSLQLARPWRTYLHNAAHARHGLRRNVDYVVVDENVQIVDQYTGRIMPDRTWQNGLQQAIEVLEGVPVQPERYSTARITRQCFLQLYGAIVGLTGTAVSAASELQSVYRCRVRSVAPNRPCRRKNMRSRFFADQQAKFAAIADEISDCHQRGQPVLAGTRTIEESLALDDVLNARGLQATVLNGIQDKDEADIVAMAGHRSAITIATNMAGRGTDIKPDARTRDRRIDVRGPFAHRQRCQHDALGRENGPRAAIVAE